LPAIAASVRSATMGRPALHMTPTQVRLPKVVRDRITDLVGKKGMAAFIREAIEEKLAATEAQAPRKPSSPPNRTTPKTD
jgi:hypothetical protein